MGLERKTLGNALIRGCALQSASAIVSPFMDTVEAAAYLRLSPKTLEADRLTHRLGIPYRRVGRKVVYHVDDLAATPVRAKL